MKPIPNSSRVSSISCQENEFNSPQTRYRKNLQLMREREIEALVELARNGIVDQYEDVITRESSFFDRSTPDL